LYDILLSVEENRDADILGALDLHQHPRTASFNADLIDSDIVALPKKHGVNSMADLALSRIVLAEPSIEDGSKSKRHTRPTMLLADLFCEGDGSLAVSDHVSSYAGTDVMASHARIRSA
jgi:hypothetical protein